VCWTRIYTVSCLIPQAHDETISWVATVSWKRCDMAWLRREAPTGSGLGSVARVDSCLITFVNCVYVHLGGYSWVSRYKGADVDGTPPCPAWENPPMVVVTVQGALQILYDNLKDMEFRST
jgi:hypothetical protein